MAIIAYLLFRSKGGSDVSTVDPLKEVEIRNLQLKEQALTKELETDIITTANAVNQTKRTVSNLESLVQSVKGLNHTDVFVRSNARKNLGFFSQDLQESRNKLATLNAKLDVEISEANSILNEQSFYGQETLTDIRKRLNSDESL